MSTTRPAILLLTIALSLTLPAHAQKEKYKTATLCNCHRVEMNLTPHDIQFFGCLQDFNDSIFVLVNDYHISDHDGWDVMTGMGALCIMVPPQDSLTLDNLVRQAMRDGKLDAKRYLPIWSDSRETLTFAATGSAGKTVEKSYCYLVLARAQVVEGANADRHSVPAMDGSAFRRVEIVPSTQGKGLYSVEIWLSKDGAIQFQKFAKHNIGKKIAIAIGDRAGTVAQINSTVEGDHLSTILPLDEACAIVDAMQRK